MMFKMFNYFEMCWICHQPVCLHVEEIMRLSNDLAESNMWREKLSDKINERDAELATLAQTANELRAENERLRGKGEPSK